MSVLVQEQSLSIVRRKLQEKEDETPRIEAGSSVTLYKCKKKKKYHNKKQVMQTATFPKASEILQNLVTLLLGHREVLLGG